MEKYKTLEEELLILKEKSAESSLSIEQIIAILSGKGRVLILLFLSLPFCQPIQIPGFSTPFGLLIAFFGLRMSFGKHLWLPQSILTKSVPSETLQKITDKSLVIVRKLKPWIHPRLDWLCHSVPMHFLNGLTIFVLGILLALPLPIPLSNLTSAWSIFLISLGILEDDGVFVLVGYSLTLLTFIFFAVVVLSIGHYLGPFYS